MYNHTFIELAFDQIPDWKLIGKPEYEESVYENGIRNPVLAATWEGEIYLIGGNRRVLSLKAAHTKAELDDSLKDRPWLSILPMILYEDVPPVVRTAWALADNEERSDNPLHAYLTIKAAQEAGDWNRVAELFRYNKAKLNVVMEYDNLTAELLQKVVEGKMSKSVALQTAKMGKEHQRMLEKLAEKNKDGRITGGDVKAIKEARASAVLQTMSEQIVPKNEAVKLVDVPYIMLLSDEDIQRMIIEGVILTDFRKAFVEAGSRKIFRLNEL